MIKKFRYWLADLCLDMAIWLHFEMVLVFVMEAHELIDAQIIKSSAQKHLDRVTKAVNTPAKRGRPKGSKDTKPRVVREGVKLGRPKGRKDSVGKLVKDDGHA